MVAYFRTLAPGAMAVSFRTQDQVATEAYFPTPDPAVVGLARASLLLAPSLSPAPVRELLQPRFRAPSRSSIRKRPIGVGPPSRWL